MRTIHLALISVLASGCWTGTATSAPTTPVAALSPTTDSESPAAEPARGAEGEAKIDEVATSEPAPSPQSDRAALSHTGVASPAPSTAPTHPPAATEVASAEPAPADSSPMAPVALANAAAPAVAPYKYYLGAGAIYLPADDGYFTSNIVGGFRLTDGKREYRVGGKLGYGYSPYASVGAVLATTGMLHWWGSFGMGTSVDVGVLACSRKMGQGWDGTQFGGVLNATFRHRFERSEIGLDVGIMYAPGEKYSTAPTGFFTALFQL